MKAGWQLKPLGEICEIDNKRHSGAAAPYVGLEDIESGTGRLVGAIEPRRVQSATFKFGNQHLLYGRLRPYLNKVFLPAFEGHCSSEIMPLRPADSLNRSFLFYWITSPDVVDKIDATSTGARMPRGNMSELMAFSFPLPPLEEQKRIVAVLDEAFEGLARARSNVLSNLNATERLLQSALESAFGVHVQEWPRATLTEVCLEFGRGKSRHRPRNDPKLFGGDHPFIQTGDISRADRFIRTYNETYSSYGLAQSKKWPKGTVCVAIVGATIGESAILDFEACFPDSIIGMVPDPTKSVPEYLDYLLRLNKAELKEAGKGSAQDNINLGTFLDRLFPMPPPEVQRRVVDRLSEVSFSIEAARQAYVAKASEMEALRQSLLQKAFSGELT